MSEQIFGFGKKSTRENYSYKGKLNKTAFPEQFVKICRYGQRELKAYLTKKLAKYYDTDKVVVGDGYVYAIGDMPVCLTAHMDTVHEKNGKCREIYGYKDKKNNRNIISSPQGIGGDDRCGIYMIMNILQTTNYRPYIVFCEDEEIGGIGSGKFIKTKFIRELEEMKFFIELDRANGNDLVFYEDINYEFHDWCEKVTGYKTNYGTFSDISHLCPVAEVSGVNISCGYYNAHTKDEYVVLEEMMNGIKATKKLLKASKELKEKFEYKESRRYSSYYSFGDWYDKYIYGIDNDKDEVKEMEKEHEDALKKYTNSILYDNEEEFMGMTFVFNQGQMADYYGYTDMDCLGQFMVDHPDISYREIEDIYLLQ